MPGDIPGRQRWIVPYGETEAGLFADYAKPESFCDEAWNAIYQYVFPLAHGAGNEVLYYGDWIRTPGVAICSRNDGLRPVIMPLEATDETLEMDYTPVR